MSIWTFIGVVVASALVDRMLERLGQVKRALVWLLYAMMCGSYYGLQQRWGWAMFFALFALLVLVDARIAAEKDARRKEVR